jgi:hypothetical protein
MTTTIDFVLENFEINKTLDVMGIFETSNIPTLDTDATATYYVSLESIKHTFLYCDSDTNANTTEYYVDFNYDSKNIESSNFGGRLTTNGLFGTPDVNGAFYFNPTLAFAGVSDIGYSDSNINKRTVAHDFIRSLAVDLFNTYQGESLFQNYQELLRDIRDKFGFIGDNTGSTIQGEIANVIFEKLNAISMQSANNNLLTNAQGYKYTNVGTLENAFDNITMILMNQMLGVQPERFANLGDSNIIDGFNGLRTLPFQANDTINFKLTIHPAPDQNSIVSTEINVRPRSYKIQLILVNTNTIGDGNINPFKETIDLPIS